MTFAQDIEREAGEEKIEAIVIGDMGWSNYNREKVPNFHAIPLGEILAWDKARPLLDFNYSGGYGAPECPAIWAWTKTRVIAVAQYDGSTWLYSLPRNPVDEMPGMEGG